MTAAPRHSTLSDLERDVPLRLHTSFRVGGPAQYLARPRTAETLIRIIGEARSEGLPVTILGGGTNTLVSDQGIRGIVILLTEMKTGPEVIRKNNRIRVRALAGERLSTVCRTALENKLTGLEWAAGIPGTLGGAIMMNAGSFGSDMAAVLSRVRVLDLATLEPKEIKGQDLTSAYRQMGLEGQLILGADLSLTPGDPDKIRERHDSHLAHKKATQPVSQASGGCFFKNPSPDKPAGWLIEQAGLKGEQIGGAMVSTLHANFIINHDHATCKDILALKKKVQEAVYKKFRINLEAEVKAIGKDED